jgi:hypothetical protein
MATTTPAIADAFAAFVYLSSALMGLSDLEVSSVTPTFAWIC